MNAAGKTSVQFRTARRESRPHGVNQKTTIEQRRRIPFHTPAQLIRDAHRALVPDYAIVQFWFAHGTTGTFIGIEFGIVDDTRLSIHIPLKPSDAPIVAAYLLGASRVQTAIIIGTPCADGDDGEELSLPTVSAEALASMAAIGGIA